MNNTFIYANYFSFYQYAFILNKLVNFEIGQLSVLRETIGFNNDDLNRDLLICDTIEECIKNSTYIFIINDGYLNKKNINKIISLSKENNINVYMIKQYKFDSTNKISNINDEKPCIAIFNYGHASMNIISEIRVHNSLVELGAKPLLNSSIDLQNIFKQFKNKKILNETWIKNYEFYDVSIQYIDLQNDIMNLRKNYNQIEKMKMDYIIVLVDNDFKENKSFENYMRILFSRKIDVYVKSRWIFCGDNIFSHCDSQINDENENNVLILDLEDVNFDNKLVNDIKLKITVEEGIKCL